MKLIYNLLLLALSLTLFSASCKKEKAENPVDNLPAATQEGKNTFGCLVNGDVFIPKKKGLGSPGPLECFYQYIDNSYRKGYFFGLNASDSGRDCDVSSVMINANNVEFIEGKTYTLNERGSGLCIGKYYTNSNCSSLGSDYETKENSKGELKITRFDLINSIISGTFWFDAVNEQGEKVEVREGRFDMKMIR